MAQLDSHDSLPSSKASLKAWWKQFTANPRHRKTDDEEQSEMPQKRVFGVPLRQCLQYASVQISTANSKGDLYVWGYIPVVVAKCGLFLKENATEVPGTFRVNGSAKRMRDLQALFEEPPKFGKHLDLKQGSNTTHDVASVFRRYLTSMPEPVIPTDHYHGFRQAVAKTPFNQEECIQTCKRLIHSMPRANQYLLLYVLDLLSVFARKSDINLMTAANLAVIFRPGIISHPDHELSPEQHKLSQDVLEFLIAHQDWFMLDMPPPPRDVAELSPFPNEQLSDSPVMISTPSNEDLMGGLGRERKSRRGRRRATSAAGRASQPSSPRASSPRSSSMERPASPPLDSTLVTPSRSVVRSRTMPARPRNGVQNEERPRNVLKKKAPRANGPSIIKADVPSQQ